MKPMMHAYLICGGSETLRQAQVERFLKEWGVGQFDVVTIEPLADSMGIGDIRTFAKCLQLAPNHQGIQVGVIKGADALTLPAQQALLKTLEEPPLHSRIVLCVSDETRLLPTVVSRCQVMSLTPPTPFTDQQRAACLEQLAAITTQSCGARISWCQSVSATKDELISFLSLSISALRDDVVSNKPSASVTLLHQLLRVWGLRSTNVTLSLLFERAFLSHNQKNIV